MKRQAVGSANILEVSRVGSHEVSEALVSKRATREAEREERDMRGAEGEGQPPQVCGGSNPSAHKPAVGGVVPSDVATAITTRRGTAAQGKEVSELRP